MRARVASVGSCATQCCCPMRNYRKWRQTSRSSGAGWCNGARHISARHSHHGFTSRPCVSLSSLSCAMACLPTSRARFSSLQRRRKRTFAKRWRCVHRSGQRRAFQRAHSIIGSLAHNSNFMRIWRTADSRATMARRRRRPWTTTARQVWHRASTSLTSTTTSAWILCRKRRNKSPPLSSPSFPSRRRGRIGFVRLDSVTPVSFL